MEMRRYILLKIKVVEVKDKVSRKRKPAEKCTNLQVERLNEKERGKKQEE